MSSWLIVAGDFTPLGGMDAANHGLAHYLARRDRVHLVTHRAWDDLRGDALTIEFVPRPLAAHALGAPLLDRAGRRAWEQLRGDPGARTIVNGGNCRIDGAIVWVHYLHAAYRPELNGSAARRTKHALVHRRDAAAEHDVLMSASAVICNSARTRDDVIRAYGLDAGRISVVYYGIDAVRFGPISAAERVSARAALACGPDRPLVGFVGALGDRRKGFDTVFSAWRTLCRDIHWDADLVAVGAGAELDEWRRRAAVENLAERVRFVGFRDDVPTVLAALDALVHPARYEAYGLAVHEAICRGVPALVTAAAGVAERYPPALDDLLIRDADDAGELCERLLAWRARLESWRHGVAGVAAALRDRSWDAMAAEISAIAEAA